MYDVRTELQAIQDRIDVLNQHKTPWQRHWEDESRRDRFAEKPSELRRINSELAELYEEKGLLLEEHPELEAEFGAVRKKRRRDRLGFPTLTRAAMTAADRAARKLKIHPDFKAWCAAQQPQIRASLENWENDVIHGRFEAEREAKAQAEEERRRKTQEAIEAKRKLNEEELRRELEGVPKGFRDFLREMGSDGIQDLMVARQWRDQENRELFKLWLEERDGSGDPAATEAA